VISLRAGVHRRTETSRGRRGAFSHDDECWLSSPLVGTIDVSTAEEDLVQERKSSKITCSGADYRKGRLVRLRLD
jgi:hypothetical protein